MVIKCRRKIANKPHPDRSGQIGKISQSQMRKFNDRPMTVRGG